MMRPTVPSRCPAQRTDRDRPKLRPHASLNHGPGAAAARAQAAQPPVPVDRRSGGPARDRDPPGCARRSPGRAPVPRAGTPGAGLGGQYLEERTSAPATGKSLRVGATGSA